MTDDSTPAKVRLIGGLGPEERAKLDALLDHIYEYGTTAEGVANLAAQLCLTARKLERERCAKIAEEFDGRYGHDAACVVAEEIRRA